jgi:hypothetical protein
MRVPEWNSLFWLVERDSVVGCSDREMGHQSLREASLLSRPAATQQTQVQRLSPEDKGGFPYISFRAGYRKGGTACPINGHI